MPFSGGVYVPCIYLLAYHVKVTVDDSGLSCRLSGVNSDSDSLFVKFNNEESVVN